MATRTKVGAVFCRQIKMCMSWTSDGILNTKKRLVASKDAWNIDAEQVNIRYYSELIHHLLKNTASGIENDDIRSLAVSVVEFDEYIRNETVGNVAILAGLYDDGEGRAVLFDINYNVADVSSKEQLSDFTEYCITEIIKQLTEESNLSLITTMNDCDVKRLFLDRLKQGPV